MSAANDGWPQRDQMIGREGRWFTHAVEELSFYVLDRLPVPAEIILDVVRQVCAPFLSLKQGQAGDFAAPVQFQIQVL